jgi:hypothetical protein
MVKPDLVPPIPVAERDAVSRRQLWTRFFKVVVPPVLLVMSVLGSIIGGVAAPTEAASMGALGSILVTAFAGRFSSKVLRETCQTTTKITAMMMFILICAQVFALAFRGLHGEDLIFALFEFLPGGVAADIWFLILLIIFILGFFRYSCGPMSEWYGSVIDLREPADLSDALRLETLLLRGSRRRNATGDISRSGAVYRIRLVALRWCFSTRARDLVAQGDRVRGLLRPSPPGGRMGAENAHISPRFLDGLRRHADLMAQLCEGAASQDPPAPRDAWPSCQLVRRPRDAR